jgi:alginate O-acetyltransferase complex protein AlgJ
LKRELAPKQAFVLGASALVLSAGCGGKPPRDFAKQNVDRWKGEVQQWGGSWSAWEEKVAPYHADVRSALESRPEEIAGLVGRDGFLFFRRSVEVLVAGDLRNQKDGRDPFPAIVDFHSQLKARGVDMLFCPIPVKAAVLPERLSANAPPASGPYVDPHTRKLMAELAEAGVECMDLLPLYMLAKDDGGEGSEPFYMKDDTHWSNRALRLAARAFGERIKAYPWYAKASKPKVAYTVKKVTTKRRGDIVRMLPDAERSAYPPMTLEAEQVLKPDGGFYEDDKSSPVVLLGDSYAGVYHFEDCRHAGLTAHIAREIGMPVDLILGQGMGPKVRGKLARRGPGGLDGKKLVVWALSERDLYNYREPWSIIPLPK